MKRQLMDNFEKEVILSFVQHELTRGRSTVTALVSLLGKIYETFENSESITMIMATSAKHSMLFRMTFCWCSWSFLECEGWLSGYLTWMTNPKSFRWEVRVHALGVFLMEFQRVSFGHDPIPRYNQRHWWIPRWEYSAVCRRHVSARPREDSCAGRGMAADLFGEFWPLVGL